MSSKKIPDHIQKLVPVLPEKEKQEILAYYAIYVKYETEILALALDELKDHAVFGSLIDSIPEDVKESQNKLTKELHFAAIVNNNWVPYIESRLMQGATYAQMGIEFRVWYDIVILAKKHIEPYIYKESKNNLDLMTALCGMNRFLDIAMALVAESYLNEKQGVIEKERETLGKIIQEVTDYKYAIDESAIVAITDQKGIIKHVNDNFCKISKFSRQELIGQDHRIINSGYHDKAFIKDLWGTIANGNVWKGELKNKAKDGSFYWVDTTIVPFSDANKKPYQYLAIRSDITERKLSEEIIEHERAELRRSIQEVADYKYAIDESAIVAITDQKGIIKHVNDNFCKISKFSRQELIGQDHRIINSNHHSKEFIKDLWGTIAKGNVWKGEIKNKAKDGTYYWVDTTIVPFLDKDKKPVQYLAIRSDITERKKSEEQVTLLNTDLEKRVAARTKDLGESLDRIANFQALFETIPGMFLVLFPDLTISAVTNEYLTATMVKRNDILGKHLFEVFPDNPDDPTADGVSKLRESLNIVLETKQIHAMAIQKYDIRKEDGSYEERYWQPINKPVLNERNEVIYITHGVADVTIQLKREAEIVRISNENQDLYNSAPCGYLSVDATIFITNINQTLLDWLGYTAKEVVGKLKFEDLLSPTSKEKHLSTFEDVFRQFVENGYVNDLEFDFQRKDGSIFPTVLNSAAVFDEQGNFIKSRTVVLDNTFRKKAEHNLREVNAELEAQAHKLQASEEELKAQQEELMQANVELEEKTLLLEENHQIVSEKNHELTLASTELQIKAEELSQSSRYKSEFLANMSHELRTPLNSILLLSHILAENSENNLSDEQTEFARVINNSGNSLLELINEILDLSKIESGNMTVDIESVEVENICKSAQDLFSEIAKEKRIIFSVSFDKSKHQIIKTDRIRLEQILKNFLSNAIKFTENGSVTLIVRVPTLSEANWMQARPQDYVIFEVIDTGIGIPREKHNLVFEAFKQADGSTRRKYGGTGLGLSISKKIAQLLGGDVLLKSEVGMGSSFSLIIPIDSSLLAKKDAVVKKDGKLEIQPGPVVGREKEYSNSGVSISDDQEIIGPDDTVFLLLDTNRENANLITKALHENGHKVLIASDEVNGMELAVQHQPKGIIVSMSIPEKSGWQILTELKANHPIRHIPVILLSEEELSTKEVIANGAINYHKTPLADKAVNQLLEEFLDVHQQKPKQVLLIDGNKIHLQAIENFITTSVVRCIPTTNSKEAAEVLLTQTAHCIVIDMGLSDPEVYEILDTVKNDFALSRLPVILYAGMAFSQHADKRIRPYSDVIAIRIVDTFRDLLDKVSFYLHLAADKNIDRKQPKPYLEESALGGKHILLVDDDVRNIFSLTKVLESQKMKVTSAIDGNEALTILAKDKSIDLVLLDMMMPNKDGYETIVEIRKDEKIKHKKIIAVTAKAMLGDREKCIRAGANDYVTKPVDVDQLISLLKVWLYN